MRLCIGNDMTNSEFWIVKSVEEFYFEILSRDLPQAAEENDEKLEPW
jgi:hypothetical protein